MTKTQNTIEEQVNKARVEIYNEQKNLTAEQRAKQMQERTQVYAEKYGIKIAGRTRLSKAQ